MAAEAIRHVQPEYPLGGPENGVAIPSSGWESEDLPPGFDEAGLPDPQVHPEGQHLGVLASCEPTDRGPNIGSSVVSLVKVGEARRSAEACYIPPPEAPVEELAQPRDAIVLPLAAGVLFGPVVRDVQPAAAPVAERAEKERQGSIRPATAADIPRMVEIDMKNFSLVYAGYGQTQDELRADLTQKFTNRFNKVGGDWIQVYEEESELQGFMMCCPTSKTPEQFESWEQTTDNGTLETTYDPDGKNIYIVSLTMEGCGQAARNMVFVNQIGKMVEEGYENFFFESRLPGLRRWVQGQCERLCLDIDSLNAPQRFAFAKWYFESTRIRNGKEESVDPLLRIYKGVGCTFDKLVPDAYEDEPSMNFGAVGVYRNPMPKIFKRNGRTAKLVGKTMRRLSRMSAFSKVAERIF